VRATIGAAATDATCAPEGFECTFSNDCCSGRCARHPKHGNVCKAEKATWTHAPPASERDDQPLLRRDLRK
jgi:hypothetical protein